jgi:hypothetical protein
MWRSILAVILAPVLAAAQTAQTEGVPAIPSQPGKPSLSAPAVAKHPPASTYKPYAYYNGIRRGREEEALIQLSPNGLVTTPKYAARGIVPLKLELESADGLTVKDFRYPKAAPRRVQFQTDPVQVASWPTIRFKIHADKDAALGPHLLKGKLTFQVIPYDGSAPAAVQQLGVQVPITVVEHDAKVERAAYPFPHTPAAEVVLVIVLLPVLIAIALPYYFICSLEGPQRCPD